MVEDETVNDIHTYNYTCLVSEREDKVVPHFNFIKQSGLFTPIYNYAWMLHYISWLLKRICQVIHSEGKSLYL
jgi:hypothetical protein